MKKIINLLFGASLLFATSAQAENMVGVKLGIGELAADANSYTAGSNDYAAESKTVDSPYGAIFFEVGELPIDGLSVGLEYVPFTAHISLDKKESSTGADLDDYTTLYVQYMKEVNVGSVYIKAGMSQADISAVTNPDSTIVSQDDSIEGTMLGVGLQREMNNGLFGRIEATHTDLDDVSITTTSNGSSSVKKTGSGDITTLSISIAKSF